MIRPVLAGIAATGAMAWAVRGRSSEVFAPSFWHGNLHSRAIALTFDDGPSPGTLEILQVLAKYGVRATFFECGENVRRHPAIAVEVAGAGHEIGNHSNSHPNFALKQPAFIQNEFTEAQRTIVAVTGCTPTLLRAPYGIRWFGFRRIQRTLGLTGVMWSVIGLDWKLPAKDVASRIIDRTGGGGIVCLHDGRATLENPDISVTVEAVRRIVPELLGRGYHFETVTQLLWPPKPTLTI